MAPSTAPFKVIIVGGGPVGLLTANALHKAGIDFVLLERRDTCATHQGSSIGLSPPTMRVMDQLGLYDAIMAVNNSMVAKIAVTDKGKRFYGAEVGTWISSAHGHELAFIHRADLLDVLYNNLPDAAKEKVLTDKRISDIESDETKAIVKCEDGTSYEGSLVLGADGVHSQVRGFMRKLALAKDPKASVDEEQPFLTTYRCMFGFGPAVEDHEPGNAWECHASNKCAQMFAGKDRTWYFLYEKLEKPTRERRTYTRADEDQYLERLGDLHFSETITARDAFETVPQRVLVDLQEGTVRNYYYSRLLLAGDAANKQTPNAGNGFNCGVQDIVAISTMLHALLKGPDGEARGEVSMAAIQALLGEYQARRRPEAVDINGRSALVTRMSAFEGWQLWLMDRYITPAFKLDRLAFDKVLSPAYAATEVISYLPEHNLKHGTLPWKNMPAVQDVHV